VDHGLSHGDDGRTLVETVLVEAMTGICSDNSGWGKDLLESSVLAEDDDLLLLIDQEAR